MGKVIIFSAPSGSGKTTIVNHLLGSIPTLGFSVSATTRSRRSEEEVHGETYYFLTVSEFEEKMKNREFVESEQVYEGLYYGTLKSEVERLWAEGRHVVFDVDVKGGLSLKKYFGDKALAVFIKAPSIEEIKRRLMGRNTESDESLQKRVGRAEYELTFEPEFDVTVINDQLEVAYQDAEKVVKNFIND